MTSHEWKRKRINDLQQEVDTLTHDMEYWQKRYEGRGSCILELKRSVERLKKDCSEFHLEVDRLSRHLTNERAHVAELQKRMGKGNYGMSTPKPVVWVRKRSDDKGYNFCNKKGCTIIGVRGKPIRCRHRRDMDILGAKYDWKVRVWEPEPAHEWVYAIYNEGFGYYYGYHMLSQIAACSKNIGFVIENLTSKDYSGKSRYAYDKRTPTFGVRRLVEGEKEQLNCYSRNEWYGAFRDGKYILSLIHI